MVFQEYEGMEMSVFTDLENKLAHHDWTVCIVFVNYISREAYSRDEMYHGHGRLCVCPSPHSHTTARTRM